MITFNKKREEAKVEESNLLCKKIDAKEIRKKYANWDGSHVFVPYKVIYYQSGLNKGEIKFGKLWGKEFETFHHYYFRGPLILTNN